MKGIFFSEFLAFVESNYGLAMVDSIIEKSNLTSGGIYTAVGTYDFQEMLQLLEHLAEASNVPTEKLLFNYGCYFFSVLETRYHHLLGCYTSPIELLAAVDHHIHVEVRKLYPDAALPKFSTLEHSDKHLVLQYESSRALYQFGLGLIHKTFTHFNTSARINTKKINTDGTLVLFTIHLMHDQKDH